MKTSESKEMYLETILELYQKGARVRSIDVATQLGFSRPSVSVAIKNLQAEGLVVVAKSGELSLTQEGLRQASAVLERHRVLTEFLVRLGAERGSAEENACRMEHILTEDIFQLIKKSVTEK